MQHVNIADYENGYYENDYVSFSWVAVFNPRKNRLTKVEWRN